MNSLLASLARFPIMPVLTIESLRSLDALAALCLDNQIGHLEITLRTPQAIPAIAYLKLNYPELLIGAGSILNLEQLEKSMDSGADFYISPGISPALCEHAGKQGLTYFPGVQTPSEIMLALSFNIEHLKYFPAQPDGNVRISTLKGPFPSVSFCPTGGIDINNLKQYLSLGNVFCVGMTRLISLKQFENNQLEAMEIDINKAKEIAQKCNGVA